MGKTEKGYQLKSQDYPDPFLHDLKASELFKNRQTSIICLPWYYYQHIMDTECNILFIQSLSSHEHLHLIVQRKCPIIFSEAVEQFDILEFLMLITD